MITTNIVEKTPPKRSVVTFVDILGDSERRRRLFQADDPNSATLVLWSVPRQRWELLENQVTVGNSVIAYLAAYMFQDNEYSISLVAIQLDPNQEYFLAVPYVPPETTPGPSNATTTTTTPPPSPEPEPEAALSMPLIIGGAAGGVVALLGIAVLIWYCRKPSNRVSPLPIERPRARAAAWHAPQVEMQRNAQDQRNKTLQKLFSVKLSKPRSLPR